MCPDAPISYSQEWTSQVTGCDGSRRLFPQAWPMIRCWTGLWGGRTPGTRFMSSIPTLKPASPSRSPMVLVPRGRREALSREPLARVNYLPTLGTYLVVNDSDENAYTVRMSPSPDFPGLSMAAAPISASGLFTAGNTPSGPYKVSARIGSVGVMRRLPIAGVAAVAALATC